MQLKIGMLLPRADMFPTLARDILSGIKLAMAEHGSSSVDPEFIIEGIGNAADESLVEKAEKMLLQEDVDITISFCGSHILDQLVTLFDAYKSPLIHLDLGGVVLKEKHISPYVLHLTLNLWQSAYMAGKYAAQQLGKKAVVAASFYDGGYHLTACFARGLEDHGGEILKYYVSPMDYKSESFEGLINLIEDERPDFLFSIFSYKEAVKVFEAIAGSELNGQLPILAMPLMTDEENNPDNYKLDKVYSMATWSFDDDLHEMQSFITAYTEVNDKKPNIMGLMGYEAGLIINKAVQDNGSFASKIGSYAKEHGMESPRGKIDFNSYFESRPESLKVRQFNYNEITYHNTIIDEMETSLMEDLYKAFESLPDSTWKNPYICT